MWLIHSVGKYRMNWNRALWISFLSTQTATKHMPVWLSEHTARTQFWELAIFFFGCNTECFIFQCHTIVISFHSMVLGLVGSQLLCTYFPSFSFLSHKNVCQLLSLYICKIRTSYYQSFERHTVQISRKKICRFHLHGLRRISFDFYSGSLWILHSAMHQDQSFQVYL